MRYLIITLCAIAVVMSLISIGAVKTGTVQANIPTIVADGPSTMLDGIDWDEWLKSLGIDPSSWTMLDGIDWDEWLKLFKPPAQPVPIPVPV